MGNLFTECQRCSIVQCEACTEVVLPRLRQNRGAYPDDEFGIPGGSGPSTAVGRGQANPSWAPGGVQDYQPTNLSEAELIQQAIQRSRLEASLAGGPEAPATNGQTQRLVDDDLVGMQGIYSTGFASSSATPASPLTEDELLAQAIDKEERAQLRQEQNCEYEESLRIDQQRQEERIRKEEDEQQRAKEAQEEEKRRIQQQRDDEAKAEAEKEELRLNVTRLMEEARSRIGDEPPPEEPGRVVVRIRTPEGKSLKRGFRADDAISKVYDFTLADGGEVLACQQFRLFANMPRTVYENRALTLQQAGLQGQCALLVEIIESDDECEEPECSAAAKGGGEQDQVDAAPKPIDTCDAEPGGE